MRDTANLSGRELAKLARAHVSSVTEKIQSGEYPTEETKCFCGADSDRELITKDRYGMPHRMVVCEECALIRVNPSLTKDAYRSFYNDHYRHIHFAEVEEGQRERGRRLASRMMEFDFERPKVVVDFGCHKGGMLDTFKEAGSVTYGIEWDEAARKHAESKGHVVVSDIQQLIDLGVKADLVIMQDVIEHLTDLHEMKRVSEILAPSGHLFVWTPGFFRSDLKKLWQLAHTYQFCARSIEYVMGELGFDPVFCDEDIESFWVYSGERSMKFEKPGEWAEYILDDVFPPANGVRRMPTFRGVCKFTPKQLYGNIDSILSKKLPDLYELRNTQSGDLVILGGGPSVDSQVDKLHELKAKGIPLMVISRMYPWCKANGLKPDYVVSLDCMEEQEKGFSDLQPDVTYLLATVTRPSIVEMLDGEKRYVWDTKDDRKVQAMRLKHGYEVATVINGGGSVTIACFSLAMNIGFKNLHVFGFDCMMTDPAHHHASGISGQSEVQRVFEVEIQGQSYFTTGAFLEFARQTLDLIGAGHQEGLLESATFYGESLINKMWNGRFDYQEEAA
jgi:predicted TPR repeat methyltransferase